MQLKNHHVWVFCLIGLSTLSAIRLGGHIGLRAYGQPEQAFVSGDVTSIRTAQSFRPLSLATDETTSYLPLFMRNFPPFTSGIYGRVTYKGKGVGNIKLELRYYDGQAWLEDPVKETLTRSDGLYLFDGINSLGAEEYYHVRFGPNNDDRFVYVWTTRALAGYTQEALTHGGDFDIADIELTDPEPGGTLMVPVTFKWLPRGIGDEVYQVRMIDAQSRFVWSSEPPVAGDSYTLLTLPNGVHVGQPYRWYVVAYSAYTGYGESLYYRDITFTSATPAQTSHP